MLPARCYRAKARERERYALRSSQLHCEVCRTNAASRAGKTRGKDEDGATDAGPDMSWYITSAMFNRFPGLPEFLELPWAPSNCWLTRVKVPKCQCRLGFSNGDRVSDAARAAFKDTHRPPLCRIWQEFGNGVARSLLRTDFENGPPLKVQNDIQWRLLTEMHVSST